MKRFAQAAVTVAAGITAWSAVTATDYSLIACSGDAACAAGHLVKAGYTRPRDCLRARRSPMDVCAAGCEPNGNLLRCRRICQTETC